ncbi:MAG: translocation/assembly module TamB [Candidatus Stahlbacteria bacterium]|nr:translocation/assembly module TamB [Candidatus Stahlbacteria bacterium]
MKQRIVKAEGILELAICFKMTKYRVRIIRWITIITLPILIGVFFILLHNGFIFKCIKNKLNATQSIRIDKIEGNLFTHLELSGVKVGKVFTAPCVLISYTPISIIKKQVKKMEIRSPVFRVSSGKDINVTFPFNVNSLILNNGKVLELGEYGKIDSIRLTGILKKEGKVQRLDIDNGEANFNYQQTSGKIDKIKGTLYLDKKFVRIDKLSADIMGGKVRAYGVTNKDSSNIKLYTDDLSVYGIVKNIGGIVSMEVNIKKNKKIRTVDGRVEFRKAKYKGESMGDGITHIDLVNNELNLKIDKWNIGKLNLHGKAYINLSSMPFLSYRAVLEGEQIDLSKIIRELPTNLAGNVKIEGKGSEFNSIIELSGMVREINLNSIQADITYKPDEIKIASLKGVHKAGEVIAAGEINEKKVNLSLSGKDIEIGLFLPQVAGISNFDLAITGQTKIPSVTGTFYVKDFKSGKIKGEYLSGNLNLVKIFPPQGNGEVEAVNLGLGNNKFETFKAIVTTAGGEHSNYEITAHSEDMELNLKGDAFGENFTINPFSLRLPSLQVANKGDVKIQFNQNRINISSCNLLVNDSLVQISGEGSKDKLAMAVVGKDLILRNFSNTFDGIANFTCNLTGTLKSPIISLASDITNFSYSGMKAERILLAMLYQDYLLHIERGELNIGDGVAKISGTLPIKLPLLLTDNPVENPVGNPAAGGAAGGMDIEVGFYNFGEDIFLPYHKFVKLDGCNLNGNFKLKGSGKQPIMHGNLNLKAKSIDAKFLGTTLASPVANLSFEGNKLTINNFEAKTTSGFLKIKGNACLPDKLDLDISAKDLQIRSIEDADATISMNLALEGSSKAPLIQGDITIEEARVTKPFQNKTTVNLQTPVNYDLTVDFPKKVRITNSLVDVEIEGKVKIKKENNIFFLSGDTKVKEGYVYYYVGPPFKINSGEFRFKNSPEINPDIDLMASTTVSYTAQDTITNKDTTVIDTINLQVSGTMREPDFILSASPPMPFEDIISLLSLNMRASRFQELESNRAYGMGITSLSYYALSDPRVVKQLNKLKSQIGIDALRVEEIMVGEETHVRFNVGKYIRDDLYISYTNDIFSPSKYNFKAEYSPWKYSSFIGETEEDKLRAGIQFKIRY